MLCHDRQVLQSGLLSCGRGGVWLCGCDRWRLAMATYAMCISVGSMGPMCYTLYSGAGRYSTIAVGVHCSQKRVYWQAESCPERPSWASHHATYCWPHSCSAASTAAMACFFASSLMKLAWKLFLASWASCSGLRPVVSASQA